MFTDLEIYLLDKLYKVKYDYPGTAPTIGQFLNDIEDEAESGSANEKSYWKKIYDEVNWYEYNVYTADNKTKPVYERIIDMCKKLYKDQPDILSDLFGEAGDDDPQDDLIHLEWEIILDNLYLDTIEPDGKGGIRIVADDPDNVLDAVASKGLDYDDDNRVNNNFYDRNQIF